MNNNTNQDQEIDLSVLSKKIGGFFDAGLAAIFNGILFIKKNIIIIGALFIAGAVVGTLIDNTNNNYEHQIIVSPNFGSVDYLYAKTDLLMSRILNKDSVFLKSIGIKNPNKLRSIKVEPIVDIYTFVNNNTAIATNAQNTQNFELMKLLAEDGDINKVIKDKLTSKNYYRHNITIVTDGFAKAEEGINPILRYFNKSEYFQKIQAAQLNNLKIKMQKNNIIINQIDDLLDQFSNSINNNQKSDKLVYYNENTQLNEIIQTKNGLIGEIGYQKLELINLEKIINDITTTINFKNDKGLVNKLKLIFPILFVLLFFCFNWFMTFYRNQKLKSDNNI